MRSARLVRDKKSLDVAGCGWRRRRTAASPVILRPRSWAWAGVSAAASRPRMSRGGPSRTRSGDGADRSGPSRVRTAPPETSMTAGRPPVRSSIEMAGPSGSPSRRKRETGKANQWLRNSSPSSGWAMYLIPQTPRASSTGWSSAPASVRWNSVVATGGAASSRRTRPAASSSRRRSESRLVAMPGSPFFRSVYRHGPCRRSSRTISRVHRSPIMSRALATEQYWP